MTYATVSSKGQITLPAEARRSLGIRPRDRITIEVSRGQIVLRAAPGILRLAGMAGKAAPRGEERAGAMDHVAGRHAKSPR